MGNISRGKSMRKSNLNIVRNENIITIKKKPDIVLCIIFAMIFLAGILLPIIFDEVNTFRPSSNPALDVCDYVIYMAYRNNKIEQSSDYVFNREETNPFVIKHCDNVTIE